MKCEQCRFFQAVEDSPYGLCRRYPPQMLVTRLEELPEEEKPIPPPFGWAPRFPVMPVEGWCGEFTPKPETVN